MRRSLLDVSMFGAVAGILGLAIVLGEYVDLPFPFTNHDQGRTKNAISSVVAGVIGQELYGNSSIDLDIQKKWFPDAKVQGSTTADTINTHVDLMFTENIFTAQRNPETRYAQGVVDKSEIDWKVNQTAPGTYEISRFGPKFDSTLRLHISDGKIFGEYERPGPNFDWNIAGTYEGKKVNIKIDAPLTLGIVLDGTISGQSAVLDRTISER